MPQKLLGEIPRREVSPPDPPKGSFSKVNIRGEKNNEKNVVSYSLSPPDFAFMCVFFRRGTGLCWLAVMPQRVDGGLDGEGTSLGKEVSLQGWDQTLLGALQLPRAARQEQGEAPVLCWEENRVDFMSRACSARAGADPAPLERQYRITIVL